MPVNPSSRGRTSTPKQSSTRRSKSARGSAAPSGRKVSAAGRSTQKVSGARLVQPGSAPADPNATSRPTEAVEELVDGVATKLHELERDLDELRARLAERPVATDAFGVVAEIFADELRSLLGDAPPDSATVRRAARLAIAERAWQQGLGELWETKDVIAVLGVSKQRVSTLAKEHRLIALTHDGRRRFPAWQFAGTDGEDRFRLAEAHRALVEDGHINPWSAASWFLTNHPELDDSDPVEWLRSGGDPDRLLAAAERDAARAAQ